MAIAKKTRSSRLLVVILVSVCLVTITIDYRQGSQGPLASMGRTALSAIGPMQEAVSRVTRPVGDFFSAVTEVPSLRTENRQLRDQILRLERLLGESTADQVRLKELQALFGLTESLDPETTGALVIGSGPSNFEKTVVIDKGSADGIREDMPVIGPAGLVGRVARVTDQTAQVQLIIDFDSGVGARLLSSRQTGVLEGRGAEDLELRFVEADTPVEPEEPVVTSGGGGLYPPGIPIGTVSRVQEDPAALSKLISVRPAVDFSALELVAVVLTERTERPS